MHYPQSAGAGKLPQGAKEEAGACCLRSADTFANVKKAVAELGLSDEVLNIGDNVEIAKYGVIQTPALVIDSKVVSYGRLIKVEDAKKLIKKAGVTP